MAGEYLKMLISLFPTLIFRDRTHTLEMKKHVGSIVLEHLSDKLDVDILNIDLL